MYSEKRTTSLFFIIYKVVRYNVQEGLSQFHVPEHLPPFSIQLLLEYVYTIYLCGEDVKKSLNGGSLSM